MGHYWSVYIAVLAAPFRHIELVWGIVPLYFSLLLNELTSTKPSFRTALQTGFSFLWAGAQWVYPYFLSRHYETQIIESAIMRPVKMLVTCLVILFGLLSFYTGLRKKFPKYGRFLGQTRFASYFMIAIFPMQASALAWTWDRLAAILIFAVPIWLLLHFGLMPFRGDK